MDKYIESHKAKIYLKEDMVKDSKTAILLLHGFGEHSGRYMEFISRLNEDGYSVFSIDLRGHGKTLSKKGDLESIKKVLKDIEVVVKYIKNNYNFTRIGIFGHSTGGLVASLYTSFNEQEIDFIVLSSPAIYCPKKFIAIRYIPYKLISFVKLKKRQSESQEMLEYSKKDKYALQKFSIRSIGVIFKEGVNLLNKKININCPTLLVCGKKDKLLNETFKFECFMKKINNERNKVIIYEDAKHRIVHNDGREKRINDILFWLKEIA